MRLSLAFATLLAVRALGAQAPQLGAPAPAAPSAVAVAVRAVHPPAIDGREDDDVWRTAPEQSAFFEFVPTEGKPPRFRTTFKAAYDDRNLYVFVRAYDPHPDSIMTALTRRDVRGPADQLKVMVDSYHDRRSGFEFAVNPVGVKRDYAMYNDRDEDDSWDGVWEAGTRIDSVGWTAEFRIPFSQLRYESAPSHVFGFAVWRDIERFKERTSWPLYRQSQTGISSQLGELRGIDDIVPFRRLEVVPYVVAKSVTVDRGGAAGSPAWRLSQKSSAGGDLKFGVTPNITVDATVNPDFGQVEADPAVLNLSAFETFFQEKRPFFLEGAGLYRYDVNCNIVTCSGEGMFYSRRIGRTPQLLGRYGDDASPNVTPIVAATKVTGRLPSNLDIGVLEAVTGRVEGTQGRTTEPRTSYTVARAQQDFRRGETGIGAIVTAVGRAQDGWTDTLLRHDAFAGGLNAHHRWGRSRFELNASVMASSIRGTAQSIALAQTSAVHFYQRPGDRLTVNPLRTALTGDAEELSFSKLGGNMVHFQTSYSRLSPGFDVNDLGYLRRANLQTFANWMGLQFLHPTGVYRQMFGNFNAWGTWTADGLVTNRAVNTNWHATLLNTMLLNAGVTINRVGDSFCDDCARGGPAMRRSPYVSSFASWQGDDRRAVVPQLFVGGGRGDAGRSRDFEVEPQIELRPLPQLQVTLGASLTRNTDDNQWLGNYTEAGIVHYTFVHLEQQTHSASVRLSYAATTALTLQLYAEPFVSRGRYSDPRELSATPGAKRPEDRFVSFVPAAGVPSGFDAMQFRSNSVLRWEFRPGSTLYVVWSHGRDGYDPSYRDRSWRDEYDNLFALHPDNTFLVKLAYWLE